MHLVRFLNYFYYGHLFSYRICQQNWWAGLGRERTQEESRELGVCSRTWPHFHLPHSLASLNAKLSETPPHLPPCPHPFVASLPLALCKCSPKISNDHLVDKPRGCVWALTCAPCSLRHCSPFLSSLGGHDDIILSRSVSCLSFPFFLWPFPSLPTLHCPLGEPPDPMVQLPPPLRWLSNKSMTRAPDPNRIAQLHGIHDSPFLPLTTSCQSPSPACSTFLIHPISPHFPSLP